MSRNLGYLQVTQDGRFKRDIELNFNPFDWFGSRARYNWINGEESSIVRKNGDWIDGELDISDIPPTVLFMGIVNSYSMGFELHVPTDMPISRFSELAAEAVNIPSGNSSRLRLGNHTKRLDIKYLNQTGRIKSIKQWNQSAYTDKSLWILDNDKCSGSIQEIVADCRKFLKR